MDVVVATKADKSTSPDPNATGATSSSSSSSTSVMAPPSTVRESSEGEERRSRAVSTLATSDPANTQNPFLSKSSSRVSVVVGDGSSSGTRNLAIDDVAHSNNHVTSSVSSKYLVSEHEEDCYEYGGDDGCDATDAVVESSAASSAAASSRILHRKDAPTEIPPEPEGSAMSAGEDGDDEEDESDYEYDYEDEDDTHIAGFLAPAPAPHPPLSTSSSGDGLSPTAVPQDAPQRTNEEKGGSSSPPLPVASFVSSPPRGDDGPSPPPVKKNRWREPSQEAVSMSLRAEREKTGGKRRLASDLYKVMMGDTEEAGFSLEPKNEDSMEKWKIKLFKFDEDSNLAKDLVVMGMDHVELEMSFPEQYPFEPPFVRVVRPRFKRQTGFVMNGALCMELLTSEGWNPVNDIESVIVSVRSLLVVGDGRLAAVADMPEKKREAALVAAKQGRAMVARSDVENASEGVKKRKRQEIDGEDTKHENKRVNLMQGEKPAVSASAAGQYTVAEAKAAYSHLSDYHKKKGWDSSGWWARKG